MAARLVAALPRFVILVIGFLLASAAATFAAQRTIATPAPAKARTSAAPAVLVVPDVRGQAYVFAKGLLEDGGFAWRVEGKVRGYAANTVADQSPAPGTRVVDTGAPTIELRLQRNPSYAQEGTPEDAAPFHGSPIRLVDVPKRKPRPAAPAKRASKPKPTRKPKAKPAPKQAAKAARPAAFVVPGARKEPLGEISLPARARRLDAWLTAHPKPTNANVRAYLYQHAWIVTGARLGWWHGAEALRLLIRTDRRAQKLWGLGAKNELVASRALRFVEARSR